MPIVSIQIVAGLNLDQKRKIAEEVTRTLVSNAGTKPERTHIIFQDIGKENWSVEGQLVIDRTSKTS
ncbi:4-oxalocrotonate tautomerase [Comamonadaceae bacterium]